MFEIGFWIGMALGCVVGWFAAVSFYEERELAEKTRRMFRAMGRLEDQEKRDG